MHVIQPVIENDFDIDVSGLELDEPDSSNKTVVRYQPHGTCAKLFSLRDPEIIISGPAGTGKSRSVMEKMHLLALKYPGFRGVMLRKSRSSLTQTAMITFENHVLHPLDGVVFVGMSQEYRYPNGSIIVVGGLDKASKIMSSEYDFCFAQESTEISEADWEAITTRLRNNRMPYQQIIGDCNPDSPTHWIKLRAERKQLLLLESRHEDNPTVTPEYLAKLDCLTGVRLLRLRHGIWAAAEGMVYEMWDPNIHVIPRFKIPNDWPRYWSIDFGFTNPFVWQCWAEDNDGRVYLYREMYVTRHLVEDLARDMLRIVGWQNEDGRLSPVVHGQSLNLEPLPQAIICDHDAEDRATLERHLGMPTRPAYKPISIGIQAVASRLNKQADGKPRLFIFDDALIQPDPSLHESRKPVCTADEFLGYVWDKGRSGDGTLEKPIKRDDHGLDSLRYLISHLERLSELDNVETGYFVMDDKVSISRF